MTIDNINPLLKSLERPIGWFKQDPHNARLHGARNLQSIRDSLTKFAQQKPIVCLNDGTVVAGNGTLSAASALGWTKLAAVIFTDEAKAKAYAIADNRSAELAEWDEAALAASLRELSTVNISLEDVGFDADALKSIIVEPHLRTLLNLDEGGGGSETGEKYTAKIVSPVYEPKNEKPSIKVLVDSSKTEELVKEIDAAGLPPDVSNFLKHAAQRHTVFNFRNIADFYAHSDAKVQRLFERSALVIIDFNKAIENGFVQLSGKIDELIEQERARGDGDEDA